MRPFTSARGTYSKAEVDRLEKSAKEIEAQKHEKKAEERKNRANSLSSAILLHLDFETSEKLHRALVTEVSKAVPGGKIPTRTRLVHDLIKEALDARERAESPPDKKKA